MESVVEQTNQRLNDLSSRMNSIEGRMNAIETRMNFQIGLTFAVWATVVGVLLAILFKV